MRRFIVLAALWAFICLVIFMPARWMTGFIPAEARAQIVPGSVAGSIWNGQAAAFLPKTKWPVTLSYKLSPLGAILGRPFTKLVFFGDGLSGAGHVGLKGAKDIKTEFQLGQLPVTDPRLAGVSGDVFITLESLKYGKGCEAASGQARTNILTANKTRWQGWSGPILSGPISCEDGTLKARLSGRDKDIDVTVDLHLFAEGRYDMDMQLQPQIDLPPELTFVLSAVGFESQSNGTMRLREQGDIFQGVKY